MKLFASLLLAGFAALTTPAHAQQTTARPAAESAAKPATNRQDSNIQAARARGTNDAKLTWQQRRAIKRRKLTPYAEAMLHNELLREEPAKTTGAGLL